MAELNPVNENTSPQYSYEANDGQIYVANTLEDAINKCPNFLGKIAAQSGGFEAVQKILEFSSRGLKKIQEDVDNFNEKESHKSNKHQDQDLQIKNQVADKKIKISQEIITKVDHPVSLDEINYYPLDNQNDLKASIDLKVTKVSDLAKKNEVIFQDNLNQVVEFKEVEVIIDHLEDNSMPFEPKTSSIELSAPVEQTYPTIEVEPTQQDFNQIERTIAVELPPEDLLTLPELIEEEVIDPSVNFEKDDHFNLKTNMIDSELQYETQPLLKNPVISDQEINLTISLIEAFDINQEEIDIASVVFPSAQELIQSNLDLIEPLHLIEVSQQINQRTLEESFVGLVKVLEENKLEIDGLDYIKDSLVLMENIVTIWDQQQNMQTELVKQIFQLLIQLGYNQPRQYLVDFVAQYGFDFLIENLRYLLMLFNNSVQFEKISNNFVGSIQNDVNQDILGFIFNLINRFIIGFQPLFD